MPRVDSHDAKKLGKLLEAIYNEASALPDGYDWQLTDRARVFLDDLTKKCQKARSGFVNVVTCLAAKALKKKVDCRYHRPNIGSPNYFTGRTLSEDVVAPWLRQKDFEHANSGWQTRTFERPKPYTLDYGENIAYIKDAFLGILHEVQVGGQDAREALKYLFAGQITLRDARVINIAQPSITQIPLIISYFRRHLSWPYTQKGTSRLPVLMIYATYLAMKDEVHRYENAHLLPLRSHSAADSQTGAIGDIELEDGEGKKFEGVEVKHAIPIGPVEIGVAFDKFKQHQIKRYYLLTTAEPNIIQEEACTILINQIYQGHGCQVIVNGVLPTIRYYLRLLQSPDKIFPFYRQLLKQDIDIGYEHRLAWNKIVSGTAQ